MNSFILEQVKVLYDYMKINDNIEKVDAIIGCGCGNLEIPVRCAQLMIQNFADYIVFTGGLGKYTKNTFKHSEARVFQQIAIEQGMDPSKIYLEEDSTNLPQNFINTKELVRRENLTLNTMLLVHSPITTRRTLATAKVYFPDKKILVTTPISEFEEYIQMLQQKNVLEETIQILVGNIQRMIVTPPMGYQIKTKLPKEVEKAYYILKENGYTKHIYRKGQIDDLIKKHGLIEGEIPNYFG